MKHFVVPAVLAVAAALLNIALAGYGSAPAISAEPSLADAFPRGRGPP
jgi:hypothetical protein